MISKEINTIEILQSELHQYGLENNLMVYYYSFDGGNFKFSINVELSKIYKIRTNYLEIQFCKYLQSTQSDKINEFLNAQFLSFSINYKKANNWKRIKKNWIAFTLKKGNMLELNVKQKDAFYTWFETKQYNYRRYSKKINTLTGKELDCNFTVK